MEAPHRLRAVAFDAVGTLIHPDPPAAAVYAAVGRRHGSRLDAATIRDRFGAAFRDEERRDHGGQLVTSEERERRRWREIVARVLDDVADATACFGELYDHFAHPDAWHCEAETADILVRLRRDGYSLALASNYDHRLRGVVAGMPQLAAVTTIVISAEVGWRKPSQAFFARLAETLDLPPSAVLYVGDDLSNDYEGARRAGMSARLFDPLGRHPELAHNRIGKLGELRLPPIA